MSVSTHGTLETPALPPTHVAADDEKIEYLVPPEVPGLRRVHDSPPLYVMENFLSDEVCCAPLNFPRTLVL